MIRVDGVDHENMVWDVRRTCFLCGSLMTFRNEAISKSPEGQAKSLLGHLVSLVFKNIGNGRSKH